MKILNIAVSYCCKEQVISLYNDLKQQTIKSDIILVDNSPNKDEIPDTPDTIWVGRVNIGFGGCYDFILNQCNWHNYDFVGIHNIDVSFPHDTLEKVFSHDLSQYGIISPSVTESVWKHMHNHEMGLRTVDFVESICWFIRPSVLEHLKSKIPLPRFNWLIDIYLGLFAKCAVCDDILVKHSKNDNCNNLMGKDPEYRHDAYLDGCDWLNRCKINIDDVLRKYDFFPLPRYYDMLSFSY